MRWGPRRESRRPHVGRGGRESRQGRDIIEEVTSQESVRYAGKTDRSRLRYPSGRSDRHRSPFAIRTHAFLETAPGEHLVVAVDDTGNFSFGVAEHTDFPAGATRTSGSTGWTSPSAWCVGLPSPSAIGYLDRSPEHRQPRGRDSLLEGTSAMTVENTEMMSESETENDRTGVRNKADGTDRVLSALWLPSRDLSGVRHQPLPAN